MSIINKETFCPTNREDWRKWLAENHQTHPSIWLVCYKVSSGKLNITWDEAVDEALCFGWIDSTRNAIDDEKFMQFFCKRKPQSTWSKINKDKVKRLIADGLMTAAGMESIKVAKANGSWSILDEVEKLIIPPDLELAFHAHPGAKEFYLNLSKSFKKGILYWIVSAKRAETRQKRIDEAAACAAKGLKPKHMR